MRRLSTGDAQQIIRHEGCTVPDGPPKIGLELEWLTWASDDPRRRVTPAEIDSALDRTRPLPHGGRVTVEPGGQVELSSPPQPSLEEALGTTAADAVILRAALAASGIRTESRGLDSFRPPRRVLREPRYEAMERYFDAAGPAGRTMMCATASLQLNIDVACDPDATWQLAHDIGPVLGAAFANSAGPGCRSQRLRTWAAIDPGRTAPVGGSASGPAWAEYALAAPVMLFRPGPADEATRAVDAPLSMARWLAAGHRGLWPTEDDVAYHLTTLFPPVRPRGWLELRMIDALPDPWWQVATAVAVALLHDADARAAAAHACVGTAGRWEQAATHGLADPALAAAAERCFEAALEALPRLVGGGPHASGLVDVQAACVSYYDTYVSRGRSPADDDEGVEGVGGVEGPAELRATAGAGRQAGTVGMPAWA